MDILNTVIIAVHLLGLVVGMGSGIGLGVLMPRLASAGDDERTRLFAMADVFSRNGHIGLGVLWVTGILIVVLKYGGIGGFSTWFWIKIALVVLLSASIGMGSAAYRRYKAGNTASGARLSMTGKLNMIAGPLIILAAVFAFH